MNIDDLLAVPYKEGGRNLDGMDCYGFSIEIFGRVGKKLRDIAATPDGDLAEYVSSLNVRVIDSYVPMCGVQFEVNGRLHIGVMVSKREVLHMTHKGPRKTPLIALSSPQYFEVIDESD